MLAHITLNNRCGAVPEDRAGRPPSSLFGDDALSDGVDDARARAAGEGARPTEATLGSCSLLRGTGH